eukprot:jgi/Tetstr1/437760/TSEL_026414.t1
MRVPYQQFKHHVAAGPSGMRNEYLRCLLGEYAPASGPAAVRAMSEVASMYLQGRLSGWFNWLFASARLVAPVKKLGESGAPDVRPVAVGEAERRATELAGVDNIKEAYVSVLVPSQLGFGISAGDSMLIHGVRLIVERLGPLVDDRSAPLRSEDGVQKGAPLATTSFCVATHPEVHQCDSTLEVTDGAARFNADDGFLLGFPEHVSPALHASCTSIKTSVGLEVRFDKMQAHNAHMEAVEAFTAGAVDATVLAAVERVLGVSFDPSTYGTDTNPVVTDFLAELLQDPDPMAAEAANLSEDAVARARSMLHLLTRLKGATIRRMSTVRDAAFIDCMHNILPRFLTRNSGTNTSTPGFFDPQLGDADACVMEREAEAASGSQKELTAFLDQANNSWLRNEVCALSVTCREQVFFNRLDVASGMWTVAIPTARTVMPPHELREVAAGYLSA